jgi:hypothetical protein
MFVCGMSIVFFLNLVFVLCKEVNNIINKLIQDKKILSTENEKLKKTIAIFQRERLIDEKLWKNKIIDSSILSTENEKLKKTIAIFQRERLIDENLRKNKIIDNNLTTYSHPSSSYAENLLSQNISNNFEEVRLKELKDKEKLKQFKEINRNRNCEELNKSNSQKYKKQQKQQKQKYKKSYHQNHDYSTNFDPTIYN